MKIVGIICEYNPLHSGHARQIQYLRNRFGPDGAIVCLMSGNFVQRGQPAMFHKSLRARAALAAGADLVLELPVTYALRSAEGFAAGGVEILGRFCDYLCFGAESGDGAGLMAVAQALLSPEFSRHLRACLDTGVSFPAARAQALARMGLEDGLLRCPNDILGVEYCKAILASGTAMAPLVIPRPGDYHAQTPDRDNPSATALRRLLLEEADISPYVPTAALDAYAGGTVHTLAAGERWMLARLRTMSEAEFSQIPFGSEGLWRKLMHESRRQASLEDIAAAVKSKRYTRTRIDRMILCACLGLTASDLEAPAPYVRVLGFTELGQSALRRAKESAPFYNLGQPVEAPHWAMEQRCSDLYGLFAQGTPEPAGAEARCRVILPGK